MISSEFIEIQKQMLNDLGNRLGSEVNFSKQFIEKTNIPEIEKQWMSSINSLFNYSAFSIKLLLTSIDNYKHLSEEQLGFYIGKIAIQSFLEIINSFEQILNKFIKENENFRKLVKSRITEKIELISDGWVAKGNSKKLKSNLIKQLESKIHEMAFIRDSLKMHSIIDDTDFDILSFAWTVRNSMHMNFISIRDIDFEYPDIKTGKTYKFTFKKGQELYHPEDLISFYVITEQIIFIMLKILQHFRNENN